MKKNIPFMVLILALLLSCTPQPQVSSSQPSTQLEPIAQLPTYTAYPTNTPYPTYTFQPTFTALSTYTPFPSNTPTITQTPTPKFTPTETATPTESPTPTSTPTPFDISNCVKFSFPAGLELNQDIFRAQLDPYVGKCVRFYYSESIFRNSSTDYVLGDDLVHMARVSVITDDATPADTKKPDGFGRIWAIVEEAPNKDNIHVLHLRKAEQYPKNQLPIEEEGLYSIGVEGEKSPGIWKSGVSPISTSSCYWARVNPNTGNIIQNHFGIGGLTIRLYEGDIFETNNYCTYWYYLGP